jgi:hypothetical protein
MTKRATDRTPGIAFAFLSCNTDAKNVKIVYSVTAAKRDAHIEDVRENTSMFKPTLTSTIESLRACSQNTCQWTPASVSDRWASTKNP